MCGCCGTSETEATRLAREEVLDREKWPEDPDDATAALLNRPAGSFGVDSASYYSFVTRGIGVYSQHRQAGWVL